MHLDLIFRTSDLAATVRKLAQAWRRHSQTEQIPLRSSLAELLWQIGQEARVGGSVIRASDPRPSSASDVATLAEVDESELSKIDSLIDAIKDTNQPLEPEIFSRLSRLTHELCFEVTGATHE